MQTINFADLGAQEIERIINDARAERACGTSAGALHRISASFIGYNSRIFVGEGDVR